MQWQRTKVRAVNRTRDAALGEVRVADTSLTRAVGLLGERALAPGDGLAIAPSQGVHTFGMFFPIDVVFLDGDWRVIAFRRAMRPFRLTRLYWRSSVVLELPAGTIVQTQTAVGDVVDFEKL